MCAAISTDRSLDVGPPRGAASQDRDLELVYGGHHRAGHQRDAPHRDVVPQMDAERGVNLGASSTPSRIIASAHTRSPRRAEGELHAAGRNAACRRRATFRPDRDVPVMAAGVHLAGVWER